MLATGSVVLLVSYGLSQVSTRRPPRVVLQARSYAVALVPDTTIDLVQAARPRFSVEADGAQFAGIRLATPVPVDVFRPHHADSPPPLIRLIQSLDVTPGCTVRFEHWVERRIRLTIERLPGTLRAAESSEPLRCIVFAELLLVGDEVETVEREIERESPIALTFATNATLRLRHIPVSELRFETEEAGQLRKAISGEALFQSSAIEATLTMPDFGGEKDPHPARLGDVINLGRLHGEVVELIVGDTLRTLYRGTATNPEIAGFTLRPSLLEELAANEAVRLSLVIVVSLLGLIAAISQVVLR